MLALDEQHSKGAVWSYPLGTTQTKETKKRRAQGESACWEEWEAIDTTRDSLWEVVVGSHAIADSAYLYPGTQFTLASHFTNYELMSRHTGGSSKDTEDVFGPSSF